MDHIQPSAMVRRQFLYVLLFISFALFCVTSVNAINIAVGFSQIAVSVNAVTGREIVTFDVDLAGQRAIASSPLFSNAVNVAIHSLSSIPAVRRKKSGDAGVLEPWHGVILSVINLGSPLISQIKKSEDET